MTPPFDTPLYACARHGDQATKTPRRHKVVIVGAGPVELALAVDLAQKRDRNVGA